MLKILCPVDGEIVIANKIKDETFSKQMMGTTVGIKPAKNVFVAPVAGQMVICEGHAFAIQADNGVQVLVHIGLDTVKIAPADKEKIFKYSTKVGDQVKAEQKIVTVDFDKIKKLGYDLTTPVVVLGESTNGKKVIFKNIGEAKAGSLLYEVE